MKPTASELYESNVRSYSRIFNTVLDKAKGSRIWDTDGKEYIDFFCGAGALNYGHNNSYIKKKVINYISSNGITHALDMQTAAKEDFLNYFEENILKPRDLNYKVQFPGPTGTNAVEAAIKLARKVKSRTDIWALMGGFHGMTLGSLALTSERGAREGAGVPLEHVLHLPTHFSFERLGMSTSEYMQAILNNDHSGYAKPAALIIETVQAEGGVNVFENNFLKNIRRVTKENDILLIVDDIQVGAGRTGPFFSFERAGIVPDIVVLSKSIGGFGMPFSLTLFKPELDVWKPGEHNGTFRGFQPSIVAAKAGLEFFNNNGIEKETLRKGKIVEEFLKAEIRPLDSRFEVRGIGLIWGIDTHDSDLAKRVSMIAYDLGLIVERAGNGDQVVKIMPPLVIEDKLLLKGLEILKEAFIRSMSLVG